MWRQSQEKLMPLIMIPGDRNVFSLVVFPTEYQGDVNSCDAWKLFNKTILSKDDIQYFDVYVENQTKTLPDHGLKSRR